MLTKLLTSNTSQLVSHFYSYILPNTLPAVWDFDTSWQKNNLPKAFSCQLSSLYAVHQLNFSDDNVTLFAM